MMNPTNVIRRIDDLGRIAIPKEVRRQLRIREGDAFAIFVDEEGMIGLKPYSSIATVQLFARDLCGAATKSSNVRMVITDMHMIIADSLPKGNLVGAAVNDSVYDIILNRIPCVPSTKVFVDYNQTETASVVIPILALGEPVGAVIVIGEAGKNISEGTYSTANLAATFMSQHMEP